MTAYTLHYYPNIESVPQKFYIRLVEIERFFRKYAHNLQKGISDLTLKDISDVSVDFIQKYLEDYSQLRQQASSLKTAVSYLSAFWSYCTNYSYTVERGKPLFYRHAFDEWKIAYRRTYESLKKTTNIRAKTNKFFYGEKELRFILEFMDNSLALYLDTPQKVKNWERDKERNLAIIALMMGTGITVEEMITLTVRDIDMRKKELIVNRDGQRLAIKILDFTVPYLSQYMKYRRQWWVADKLQPALFLNQKMEAATTPMITTIIRKVGLTSNKKLSARILQDSYGNVVLEQANNDIFKLQKTQGITRLGSLEKYIK